MPQRTGIIFNTALREFRQVGLNAVAAVKLTDPRRDRFPVKHPFLDEHGVQRQCGLSLTDDEEITVICCCGFWTPIHDFVV